MYVQNWDENKRKIKTNKEGLILTSPYLPSQQISFKFGRRTGTRLLSGIIETFVFYRVTVCNLDEDLAGRISWLNERREENPIDKS